MAFLVFGLFSLTRIPIAQLPEFDANVIMVMSSYPGTSASDIEQNLTKTLENSLNGVANLKELTSRSRENISMLTLQFEYGIDIDEATNDVRDKLDMVSSVLPDGASIPTIFKFSADDMPIMIMSATADQSLPGLDKILDDKLVTPLARVSGVGTVSVQGAPSREIQVYCDPNKLQAYGLSVSTLSSIIAMENRNLPSGNIDVGSETFNLRVQKEFGDPSELLDIVVANVGGRAIYLRDVATVVDGQQEREQESYTNGKRSAQIVIQKQSGANTVNVIKNVKKKLADIQKELPSDIEITTVIDSSDNIIVERSLDADGGHPDHLHSGYAGGVHLPWKMEGHFHNSAFHPYSPAGFAGLPARHRQFAQHHFNVSAFNSNWNGCGRCHSGA